MTRFLLFLLGLHLVSCAWGEEADHAFPRNWTVNVSGAWRISGCADGERTLSVRQTGHQLRQEQGALRGTVYGHDVSFRTDSGTLDCLHEAHGQVFDGKAEGARIVGMLRDEDHPSRRLAITIQLQREFMLSFDDGPLPGKTDRVLDALQTLIAQDGKPVRAAFFTLADAPAGFWEGRYYYAPYEIWTHKGSMRRYPELIARMRAEGHVIGSHTAHHAWFRWPRFTQEQAVADELHAWEAALPVELHEKLLRPPYLVVNDAVLKASRRAGYQLVLGHTLGDAAPWASVDAVEWKAVQILETRDGATPTLLIFHDIFPATYEHLAQIVGRLQRQGYALIHFNTNRLDSQTLVIPK